MGKYLTTKHIDEPAEQELYHGTNNNILDVLYTHGLQPPSDTNASDACPVSGGKGLCTTLCDNTCKYCVEKHEWHRCHMFGLGVYLGDMAQKSHRYVSAAAPREDGSHECKMLLCSVLFGDALQVQGHLRCSDAMHSLHSLRGLRHDDVPKMLDLVGAYGGRRPVDQRDILFVKGLGSE